MDKTNKIIHKRSSVILENGKAKLPTTDQLEYGELAINFAKGAETISFKNNNDEIVSITTSTALEGIIESNMQNVQASIDAINQTIDENEEVIARALTDLDERIKSTVEVIDGIQNENDALEDRIDTKLADKVDKATFEALADRVDTNENAIAGLQNLEQAYKDADAKIREDFAAADTALEGRVDGKLAGKVDKSTVEAIDNRLTGLEEGVIENEQVVAGVITDLNERLNNVNNEFAAADTALETKLNGEIAKKANQSDFETLAGRVDVVQGEDTGKSMRTVAAEEAAKEVAKVVAEADADFDTLKEIADWILNDKTGATALQNDVAGLKDVVDGYTGKGVIKTTVDTLAGRVETNEGEITKLKGLEQAYKDADAKIREDFAAADTALEGRVDGKLAGKVNTSVVTALTSRVEANEGEITKLKAADTAIRGEFADADETLKNELTAAINNKADASAVATFDSRITDIENTIKDNEEIVSTALNDLDIRITSNENTITEIEENTITLQDAIEEMDTRIIELEEKLKDADIDGGEF